MTRPVLLRTAEAAELLTLKESTVKDYARRGLLPSVKIGRHRRFIEEDLLHWLQGLKTDVKAV
jgi:excisionase family DNA binding protein